MVELQISNLLVGVRFSHPALDIIMLTEQQEKYARTLSDTQTVHIKPFDALARDTAEELITEIKNVLPDTKIIYLGSSALGIAGENDIDLGIISTSPTEDSKKLCEIFGPELKYDEKRRMTRWEFARNDFKVELFLTDAVSSELQEQIETQKLLMSRDDLRAEYEKIKQAADGVSIREYTKRKMEFFNKILNEK